MAHIFISYSKIDTRQLALKLRDRLAAVPGMTVWMDESLESAESWALQIQQEIERCDYVVVLLSPDVNRPVSAAQRRSFVLNEIDYAQQENKPIIPVMAQKTKMPVQIAGVQYLDFTADLETGIQRLIQRISRPASAETAQSKTSLWRQTQPPPNRTAVAQRRLEAAMPQQTKAHVRTEVWVKISLPDSPGLRAELPVTVKSGDVIQQEDVRAGTFPLQFPVDGGIL